jgi:uncharacterized protein with NRDE domain
MCLLVIQYRVSPSAPILVAANREELFDRPSLPPRIQAGPPRVLCGVDQRATGTWLGVNQHGLLVAATNRPKTPPSVEPRSRGLLCREMLRHTTAREALAFAEQSIASGPYAGVNLLALDAHAGGVLQAGETPAIIPLEPGLHTLSNGDLDDPLDIRQQYARELFAGPATRDLQGFLQIAPRAMSQGPDPEARRTIVLRGPDRGTVSSAVIGLCRPRTDSVFLFANGSPDETPYEDVSDLLHDVLVTQDESL